MDYLKKLLFTILLIHFMCTMLDVGFSIESLARESTCFCNSHWRAYLQILNACICVLNSMLIGTGVGYLLNHIYDCPVAKPFISFPLMSDCSCILCTEPASNSNATPMKDQSSQANFTRPIGSEPRSLPPLPHKQPWSIIMEEWSQFTKMWRCRILNSRIWTKDGIASNNKHWRRPLIVIFKVSCILNDWWRFKNIVFIELWILVN